MNIDTRVRRLEGLTQAQRAAQLDADLDAVLRHLSDEDLDAVIAWLDTPEGKAGQQEPPHVTAAWKSACERAGIR